MKIAEEHLSTQLIRVLQLLRLYVEQSALGAGATVEDTNRRLPKSEILSVGSCSDELSRKA